MEATFLGQPSGKGKKKMSGINGLLHKQQQPQKKGTTTKAHVGVSTGTETAAAAS